MVPSGLLCCLRHCGVDVWVCGCVGVWVCEFADVNVAKSKRRGGGEKHLHIVCIKFAIWLQFGEIRFIVIGCKIMCALKFDTISSSSVFPFKWYKKSNSMEITSNNSKSPWSFWTSLIPRLSPQKNWTRLIPNSTMILTSWTKHFKRTFCTSFGFTKEPWPVSSYTTYTKQEQLLCESHPQQLYISMVSN